MSSASIDNVSLVPDELIDALRQALAGIRFGSVEILVHEGRVVQIERREKVRCEQRAFHKPTASSGG